MAQSLHIASYGPSTNLPFSICAIYFDLMVGQIMTTLPPTIMATNETCVPPIVASYLLNIQQFSTER